MATRQTWVRGLWMLCALLVAGAAQAVPAWGALQSSPVDTPPGDLAPGAWIWAGDDAALGPMVIVVSLDEQRAYVYRNGLRIAVTTVMPRDVAANRRRANSVSRCTQPCDYGDPGRPPACSATPSQVRRPW